MLFRCPDCRTRRKDWHLFAAHLRESGHRLCNCGGYHYAHRPGSPYCEANPAADMRHALRAGEPASVLQDIAMDLAINGYGRPVRASRVECPF